MTNKTINTILLHVSSSSSLIGHMVTDTADDIYTIYDKIQSFLNFECLNVKMLTPMQWVFNSLINLRSDNFMVKTSNR